MNSEIKDRLLSCNYNNLESKSLNEKKKLVRDLGIIVNNDIEVACTDEVLDSLLGDVYSLYTSNEEIFKAIYSDTPLDSSSMCTQSNLDRVNQWYGDMVELRPDATLRLKSESKRKALGEILGLTVFEFNAKRTNLSEIVLAFRSRWIKSTNDVDITFKFIQELIEKRAKELQNPITKEGNDLLEEISTPDIDDVSTSKLREFALKISKSKSLILTDISFEWEKNFTKVSEIKEYIRQFIHAVKCAKNECNTIDTFITNALSELSSFTIPIEENITSLTIRKDDVVIKPLKISESNFTLVSIGVRYDVQYIKKNNILVRSSDASLAKPIDQLINRNTVIRIESNQVRGSFSIYDMDRLHLTCKEGTKLKSLPTVSYTTEEGNTIPFYRLLMYISNSVESLNDVVKQLVSVKRPLMLSEEDLITLFKQKVSENSKFNTIPTAKIIYSVPNEILSIFGLHKTAEEYFRTAINAKGTNTNSIKEIFVKLLTSSKTIAFLTKHEIETLVLLVSKTKHLYNDQSVESCNLENVIGFISKMKQQSSINFLLVRITGSLSPTEVSRLLYAPHEGTTKLILLATNSLIASARVSGRYSEIIISKEINTENNIKKVSFGRESAIHKIIDIADQKHFDQPEIFDEIIRKQLELIAEKNEVNRRWQLEEQEWRHNSIANRVLFLINRHDREYIIDYYKDKAHIVDPLQDNIIESTTEFLHSPNPNSIFLVLESHKLSEVDKKAILRMLSRVNLSIIFVSEYFHPFDNMITIDGTEQHVSTYYSDFIECIPDLQTHEASGKFFSILSLIVPDSVSKYILPKIKTGEKDEIGILLSELEDASMNNLDNDTFQILKHNLFQTEEIVNSRISNDNFLSFLFDLNPKADMIPFHQFVQQIPLCQFLSQPLRVKLWAKHVLNYEISQPISKLQTDFLLASLLPLSQSNSHQHHESHCFLYTKPDANLQFDKLTLTQMLTKQDLDWNNKPGLETLIDNELQIMKILEKYPFSLKFLMSITVSTVYNIMNDALQECESSVSLNSQMEQVDTILSGISDPVIDGHVAVIHWIISIALKDSNIISSKDVSTMIKLKTRLTNLKALQRQVIPVIISLDGDSGFMSSDLDVKQHILQEPIHNYCDSFDSLKIGSEAVHFIFNPSNNINDPKKHTFLQQPFIQTLYKFIREPVHFLEQHLEKVWDEILANQRQLVNNLKYALSPLSKQGVLAVISKCTRKNQLFIISRIISKLESSNEILAGACHFENFELKYYLLDEFLQCNPSFDRATLKTEKMDVICKQILLQDISTLANQRLFLEYSVIIRKLFIEMSDGLSIEDIYKMLTTKATLAGCLRLFLDIDQLSPNEGINRSLYFSCWIIGSFHTNIFIKREDYSILKRLFAINQVREEFKSCDSASDLVMFFLFPSYLSEYSYNYFADIFEVEKISSTFRTVCQIASKTYPPYSCEFYCRSLPNEYIKYLDKSLQEWVPKTSNSLQTITIDVNGINIEKLKLNIEALKTAYNSSGPSYLYISNFLLCYFKTCGIDLKYVEKWSGIPNILPKELTNNDFTQLTYYPFPSLASTQIIHNGKQILLGTSKEDVIYTIRALNRIVHIQQQKDPMYFLDETSDRFGRRLYIANDRYSTPNLMSQFILGLVDLTIDALNRTVGQEKQSHTKSYYLTILQTVLQPFTRLLKEIVILSNISNTQFKNTPNISGRDQTREILYQFLSSFKMKCVNPIHQALIFKTLFSLFGVVVGSKYPSILISALVNVFSTLDMEACSKSKAEINWMSSSSYITLEYSTNDLKSTTIDSEQGDFLIYQSMEKNDAFIKNRIIQEKKEKPTNSKTNFSFPTVETIPISKQDHGAFTTITSSDKRETHEKTEDEILTGAFLRQEDSNSITVDVTGFIEIDCSRQPCYATVKVTPGNTCSLVTLKNQTYIQVLKENQDTSLLSEPIDKLIVTFASHEFLWNALQKQPSGSVLFSRDGFLLVKSDNNWKIWFHSYNQVFHPLHIILKTCKLLNYKFPDSVEDFFDTVCRIIAETLYNQNLDCKTHEQILQLLCDFDGIICDRWVMDRGLSDLFEIGPKYDQYLQTMENLQNELFRYITSIVNNQVHNWQYFNELERQKIGEKVYFKLNRSKTELVKSVLCGKFDHPILSTVFTEKSGEILNSFTSKLLSNEFNIADYFRANNLSNKLVSNILFLNSPFDFPLLKYERSKGVPVGFIVSSDIMISVLDKQLPIEKEAFLKWATVTLMSGLTDSTKVNLFNYLYNGTNSDFEPDLSPNLRVMFYCIGMQCPHKSISREIMEAANISNDLLLKKQSNYSIHFVSCQGTEDTLQQIKEMMEVEVLDYTEYYKNRTLSLPQIYLSIIEPFNRRKCGAFVRGLRTVEDSLLKWCAEYTKDVPWAYIYFEEPVTSYNLPENLDRCYIHKEYSRQIMDIKEKSNLKDTFLMTYDPTNTAPLLSSRISRYRGDWKQKILALINNKKERWMLLSGPPGIGKSHYFERNISPDYYFDGSKDILVRYSLAEVLETRTRPLIKQDTSEFVVVIDEYHMLSASHKKQLFFWAKKNSIVKLILISNRHDLADFQLLQQHFSGNVENNIIYCSGSFSEMVRNRWPNEEFILTGSFERRVFRALYLWYHSNRNLFGEEMMTYRIFDLVKECLNSILRNNPDKEQSLDKLATILQKKQPSFSKSFCYYFMSTLVDFIIKEGEGNIQENSPFSELDNLIVANFKQYTSTYMQLLVITSLLITEDQSNLTFPEYSGNLENEYQYHIITRLLAFILYMCELKGIVLDREEKEDLKNVLLRCEVVDKPCSFPILSSSTTTKNLLECEVECVKVDFNDLEMVHSMLIRGYAIDFNQAKLFWETKPIQNPKLFERILSAYPSSANFVSEDNIFNLLKRSTDTSLCKYLLKIDTEMKPRNCYFLASWKLYKELLSTGAISEIEYEEEYSSEYEDEHSFSRFLNIKKVPSGQIIHVDKLDLLVWVSKYGRSSLDINCAVDLFEERFMKELYSLTQEAEQDFENRIEFEKILEIWSGLFSCYMSVETENNPGISFDVAVKICKEFYPPFPEWDNISKILSRLWYAPCDSSRDLSVLESLDEFWQCLENPENSLLLESYALSSVLTLESKKRILKSPVAINGRTDIMEDLASSFADAIASLEIDEIKMKPSDFTSKCLTKKNMFD